MHQSKGNMVTVTVTGRRSRVGKRTVCEPQQFNDVWALILLQMRASQVPTTEETKSSACVCTWVVHSFHCIGSACPWRRGHEMFGRTWSTMVGACGSGAEDALPGHKRRRKTSLPTRQPAKLLGFMICWMDHEPIVRSLETAAIRTLRPVREQEKRKRADIERHRPPPGLCEKLPARAPRSILVTYNKIKTREKRVRPEDNPGSWIRYSDYESLYTFELKRLRPYQGPLSLMEDESLPLLVLWVCQRSFKVDWQTLFFKAQSQRPLLKCAETLLLVVSPSRRSVGIAQGFKGVEENKVCRESDRSLWRSISLRLWLLQESYDEKACVTAASPSSGLRRNRSLTGQCSKDRQKFFFPRGGSTTPDGPGKSNRRSRDEAGGQAMGRPDPPAHDKKISRNSESH